MKCRADSVFRFRAGFDRDRSPFEGSNCVPDDSPQKAKYPSVSSWYEVTNVKNMFVAGTAMHSRDWRKSSGGFIHGFRCAKTNLAI